MKNLFLILLLFVVKEHIAETEFFDNNPGEQEQAISAKPHDGLLDFAPGKIFH